MGFSKTDRNRGHWKEFVGFDTSEVRDALDLLFFVMKNSSDKWEGEKNLPAPWSIWRERVNAALATKSADPYFDRVRVLTRQLRRAGKGQWGSAKLTGTEGIGRSLLVLTRAKFEML